MSEGEFLVYCPPFEKPARLDRFLAEWAAEHASLTFLSRSQVRHLIEQKMVAVNGVVAEKSGRLLLGGEEIRVTLLPQRPIVSSTSVSSSTPVESLSLLYEDDALLVVDKPPGLTVHPGAGTKGEVTLLDLVLHHVGTESGSLFFGTEEGRAWSERPGIVHRLDKDTSGVLVVAKDVTTHRGLVEQFQARSVERQYVALAFSSPRRKSGLRDQDEGIISLPIGRDPRYRVKRSVNGVGAKEAVTKWRVREWMTHAVLLEVTLGSGRTHQIRVHLAHCGAPLIGDTLYGEIPNHLLPLRLTEAARTLGRQALHAATLGFSHPRTGKRLLFSSPPPEDFLAVCEAFRCSD